MHVLQFGLAPSKSSMCGTQTVMLKFGRKGKGPFLQNHTTLKVDFVAALQLTISHFVADSHKLLTHKARCVCR